MLSDGIFDRVYHLHCRKTAGTSVNKMFLALATGTTPDAVDRLYVELARPPFNVECGTWRFSAWSAHTLRHPQFDYGFSHIPLPKLSLPRRTFRFTVLRDPMARALSLYDMIAGLRDAGSSHPDHLPQIEWIEQGFASFVERTPTAEIAGQLSMFSLSRSVDEALERVSEIEMVIPLPSLAAGMQAVGDRFGVPLTVPHLRRAEKRYRPSDAELAALRDRLEDEIRFYERACVAVNAVRMAGPGSDGP